MTADEQNIFFQILRSSLWEKDSDYASLTQLKPTPQQMENIISAFRAHALLGVVADAMMTAFTLSAEQKRLILQHMGKMVQTHYDLDEALKDVFLMLQHSGLSPVLLKGQGLATLYPMSNTRSCGDIDIFVGRERYLEACRLIDDYCGCFDTKPFVDAHNIHWQSRKGEVEFEIHYRAADTAIPSIKDDYNGWMEQSLLSSADYVQIHDSSIRVPSISVNVLYVFEHLLKHFRYEGVGFRQFVDWMLLLDKYNKEKALCPDAEADLLALLHRFHLLDAWQVLGGIVVWQLGFPCEKFPFWNERKACHSQGRNLQYIIDSENLGQGTAAAKGYYHMPSSWHRRWLAFRYYLRFVMFEYRVFPHDTIRKYSKRLCRI